VVSAGGVDEHLSGIELKNRSVFVIHVGLIGFFSSEYAGIFGVVGNVTKATAIKLSAVKIQRDIGATGFRGEK